MRIPVPLAWVILILGCFTAGLLRQFHDRTPASPYAPGIVGSLLFAAVVFLLLVAAREWRRGAVPGRGIRLGSLTPLLLMLLVEKWVSITLYPLLFHWIARRGLPPDVLDARYRVLAGVGLVLVCLLVSRFSKPAARKTWRRASPARWPAAAAGTLLVLSGTYLLLGGLAWLLGLQLVLVLPRVGALLPWILAGQSMLAFAEELYFRGLLLGELERLAPRLGLPSPTARRWLALLATAALFGLEHLDLALPSVESGRRLIFTVSLGLLLGIIIMVSTNLLFAAGLHAWINWLLLGAAPHFVDAGGRPALPPGTYIGLSMVLAFVLAWLVQRRRPRGALGRGSSALAG